MAGGGLDKWLYDSGGKATTHQMCDRTEDEISGRKLSRGHMLYVLSMSCDEGTEETMYDDIQPLLRHIDWASS